LLEPEAWPRDQLAAGW